MFHPLNQDLYFAERDSYRIRRVLSSSRTIVTVAGNGVSSSSGDGGNPLNAGMTPLALAFDGSGNMFIGEASRIRKVLVSNNTIFSVVTTGLGNLGGIAADSAGNLYYADGNSHRIRQLMVNGTIRTIIGTGVGGSSGDGNLATLATTNYPMCVGLDYWGNVIFIGQNEQRVRRIDKTTGIVTTIIGDGTDGNLGLSTGDGGNALNGKIFSAISITTDNAGNIYIGELSGHRVRKSSRDNSYFTTVAGNYTTYTQQPFAGDGGPATAALMGSIYAVAVDSNQNIYLADSNNHRIRMVEAPTVDGQILSGTTCMLPVNKPSITCQF